MLYAARYDFKIASKEKTCLALYLVKKYFLLLKDLAWYPKKSTKVIAAGPTATAMKPARQQIWITSLISSVIIPMEHQVMGSTTVEEWELLHSVTVDAISLTLRSHYTHSHLTYAPYLV